MRNLGLVQITLLCFLFVYFRTDSFVSCLNSEGLALLSLLEHFDKVPLEVASTWKKNTSETTPCGNWFGVSCGSSGNVEMLDLPASGVSGQLGSKIGELKSLVILDLSNNSLSGVLPSSLRNCTSLEFLDLSNNDFSGDVPDIFGSLKNLKNLYLDRNNLRGLIPPSVGQLVKLVALSLTRNDLSGTIPESIGNCSKLKYLALNGNKLNGSLPVSLNLLENLGDLFVNNNSLGGRLHFGSSNCKKLVNLDLSYNGFQGGVPPEIGNCSSLRSLAIINCNLTGTIPSSLGMLNKVLSIDLSDNHLSGSIPQELGNCSRLETLKLNNNQLQGQIPHALGKLKKLQNLELFVNKLSGEIPISIWKIQSLTQVLVYNNTLTGELPVEVTQLKHLKNLTLFNNSFYGEIPMSLGMNQSLEEVDLLGNRFTGEIPPYLCHGQKLRIFVLGSNQLHGTIPASIRQCKTLERVRLEENKLTVTGEIPTALGDLINLERLNISNNKLTGSLSVLQRLKFLGQVDVSHNQFKGPIPANLISNSSTFSGNPDLCIQPPYSASAITRNELKSCKGQAKLSTWKIALIAAGSFISVLALLFALVLVFRCCKRGAKKEDANNVLAEEEGISLLLNKVLAVTDNLDDKYIIGRGAHGVVYRASLGSGEEYAVKKLNFAEHVRANQNMKREIETIGLVRHRNLIRLERFWMRKEDGLMLYQYMPNGSLHDVLHRRNQGEAILDWSARFNIALGIAHGLAYLHHDCHPPIIHRDIKPENILMDLDMEPHIGDFGLSRILDDSTVSTATVTGTTGYIAPENAYKTVRSKESDVYSYGVVLLELVTGKRAVDRSFPEDTNIVSWVRSVLSSYEDDDDTAGPIVDPTLVDELLDTKLREQAIQVTDLALRCTDKRPENRPSMRDVVKLLTDLKDFVRSTSGSDQ
ncbi:PREDICTED: leucine-rich repeat receptor-like protein kinase PEPR2 [Camelina sativa]|uniref:Leucine-rich repeat receptor-like protein kinase PEPR2 n=1 Tax=Camelina sativa TaxID=90675 RepID=A0ABM0YIP5_CAMSA|nr:PREDICTED: leucine-rich repeat receptor-like protein kinase PEPR2 [Camelina sativa]